MTIRDINRLHKQLPDLFEDLPMLEDLDDWEIVPVENAEDPSLDPIEPQTDDGTDTTSLRPDTDRWLVDTPDYYNTSFTKQSSDRPSHPGGLVTRWRGSPYPPADALAFYLPFHFYRRKWWGIYLIKEGVEYLATLIYRDSGAVVSWPNAFRIARMFLYGHEQFHHVAECFTTRLEISHRDPPFRTGVWSRYQSTYLTPGCTEESLANAFGFEKARTFAVGRGRIPALEWQAAAGALTHIIASSPPGYSEGAKYLTMPLFKAKRLEFAEEYHTAGLPHIRRAGADVWRTSPYAFGGIANIGSRVNYLVRRGDPLARRGRLGSMPFRYREVETALRGIGCSFVRANGGSHEVWVAPNGATLTVPRHPGDMATGTLRSIFKRAGLPLSQSELRAKLRHF